MKVLSALSATLSLSLPLIAQASTFSPNGVFIGLSTILDGKTSSDFEDIYVQNNNNNNDDNNNIDFDDDDNDNDDDDGTAGFFISAGKQLLKPRTSVTHENTINSNKNSKPTAPRAARFKAAAAAAQSSNNSNSNSYNREAFLKMSSLIPRGGAQTTNPLCSDFAKQFFVSALVTLMFEAAIGHSLEFTKISKQTNPQMSVTSILKKITQEKGVVGLWDGFVPWGVVQSIGKGGSFGMARGLITPVLMDLVERGLISDQNAKILIGGLSGVVQGYILSPTLLLKTRVMTDSAFREKMTGLATIIKSFQVGARVVTKEGGFALMKGANVFAFKRFFDWSTRFMFADIIESLVLARQGSLSPTDKMVCSMIGGMISSVVTLPIDALVAKIQDAKKAGQGVSPLAMIGQEFKEGGLKGLWNSYMKAWEIRALHVGLTTVCLKTWTPLAYDLIFGEKS
ncbi:hypothetical protein TrST_g4905 [Triparma strigata]|uniref:Uncharacterized protein n=1 Tax=Triparma strigata TaxID=1606541 RepID=A0A9W7BBI4_9STRA|nr:hypothetical protein TrST_g4905 [Triparma strigata]